MTGPVLAFAGLWGVPFFTTLHGISTAASSTITSTLLICYAVGATLLGILSDRIGLRKPVLYIGSIVALLAWIPLLFFPGIPLWLLVSLAILVGLALRVCDHRIRLHKGVRTAQICRHSHRNLQ